MGVDIFPFNSNIQLGLVAFVYPPRKEPVMVTAYHDQGDKVVDAFLEATASIPAGLRLATFEDPLVLDEDGFDRRNLIEFGRMLKYLRTRSNFVTESWDYSERRAKPQIK